MGNMTDRLTIDEFRELQKQMQPKKKSKYGAVKTFVDDIKFDSKAEARRYEQLMMLYRIKVIGKPILQYEFELGANIRYRCDFMYFHFEKKVLIVEDVKGVKTDVYRLKKKLMKEVYGIDIFETN